MNLKSQIHRISCFPYRHFEHSREIFLALCSFLLLSQKVSHFPLSHIGRYTGVQERSLHFARDDDTGIALSQHILYTMRGLSIPHTVISSVARNLPCTLFFLAPFAKGFPFSALSCSLRRSIPVFCYHTYGAIPVCKKDPSTSLGMTLRKWRFPNIPFIRNVGYPSPIPSFRAQREIFLALRAFLLPSQMDSRFLLSHIRHYPFLPERSLDFARDDDTGIALSKHIRCTLRKINPFFPPHTVISSAVEKSSLHSALSYSFRKNFPLFRCLT